MRMEITSLHILAILNIVAYKRVAGGNVSHLYPTHPRDPCGPVRPTSAPARFRRYMHCAILHDCNVRYRWKLTGNPSTLT